MAAGRAQSGDQDTDFMIGFTFLVRARIFPFTYSSPQAPPVPTPSVKRATSQGVKVTIQLRLMFSVTFTTSPNNSSQHGAKLRTGKFYLYLYILRNIRETGHDKAAITQQNPAFGDVAVAGHISAGLYMYSNSKSQGK